MPADFDPERLKRAWARYCAQGAEVHPAFMSYLAPGASDADIASTEEALGCALPEDLRALLRLNNGSNEYQILPGWEFFDAARIVDEWRIWESLYRSQFKPENQTCKPDSAAIRGNEWWRLRWIPFCGNGGGDHLCVDMDPADGGVKGSGHLDVARRSAPRPHRQFTYRFHRAYRRRFRARPSYVGRRVGRRSRSAEISAH